MFKPKSYVLTILRNVLRHRQHYYIMAAIGLAVFLMVLLAGFRKGVVQQLEKVMRTNYSGDFLLHHRAIQLKASPFPLQPGADQMLPYPEELESSLRAHAGMKAALKRLTLMAGVMGADEKENVYAIVQGCDFQQEENYSFKTLLQFTAREKAGASGVYISLHLAQKLNLKFGDDIFLFFMTEIGILPGKYKRMSSF